MQHTVLKNLYEPKTTIRVFESILDMQAYLKQTESNERFAKESRTGSSNFTGTKSYEEAEHLLIHGDTANASKLEAKLATITKSIGGQNKTKFYNDVVGFNANVPRYLQGMPQNMINSKRVVVKQPTITLLKSISYSCWWSTEQIINESVKALSIVHKIEQAGTRVNLDILWTDREGGEQIIYRLNVKKASERMNIAKLAFPMVNPSMLRRICFGALEVETLDKPSDWRFGYGTPVIDEKEIKKYLANGEHILSHEIKDIEKEIEKLGL